MTAPWTAAFAVFYVLLFTMALGGISAAPWVPTRRRQRDFLAKNLPMPEKGTVVELGCGDGTVLFALAEAHPGIKAVGYEIALLPYIIALARKALRGRGARNVEVRCRDFFGQDLSAADGVFVFLFRECYPRLLRKLANELKDDAVVVLQAWPFPGIAEERVLQESPDQLPVYLYRASALRAAA